jgi:hypothetical protein
MAGACYPAPLALHVTAGILTVTAVILSGTAGALPVTAGAGLPEILLVSNMILQHRCCGMIVLWCIK